VTTKGLILFIPQGVSVLAGSGDDLNLNQRLVREGWALNFEPYAKHRFKADRTTRKTTNVALERLLLNTTRPAALDKSKTRLLGSPCPNDARNLLFPDSPAMPPGCSIKGKIALHAKITGHRGITTSRVVAVIGIQRSRTVGFAQRKRLRPRGFARRSTVLNDEQWHHVQHGYS
jgi:hypothetical protein